MVGSYTTGFLEAQGNAVGCEPDRVTEYNDYEEELHVLKVPLPSGHLVEGYPEVVVDEQEDRPYEDSLHDPQPGVETSHELYAHLLVEGVDLHTEEVSYGRQDHQKADGYHGGYVTHPVVVGFLLFVLGGYESVSGVSRSQSRSENHVGDKPVKGKGYPHVGVYSLPPVDEFTGFCNPSRCGHESYPGVRHEEKQCAEDVQDNPHEHVGALPVLHPLPGVEVEVAEEDLTVHEGYVNPPGGTEDLDHVVHELGVEDREAYHKDGSEDRGDGVGEGKELGKIVGYPV